MKSSFHRSGHTDDNDENDMKWSFDLLGSILRDLGEYFRGFDVTKGE